MERGSGVRRSSGANRSEISHLLRDDSFDFLGSADDISLAVSVGTSELWDQ